MGFAFSFEGFSRKHYTFARQDLTEAASLPRQGGVFIYAQNAPEPVPVFIGESESIFKGVTSTPMWSAAQKLHSATLFFFLGIPDEQERKAVQDDLIRRYDPALNRAE